MKKRKQNHCHLICSRNIRSKTLNSSFCHFIIQKFLAKNVDFKEKLKVFQQREASIFFH